MTTYLGAFEEVRPPCGNTYSLVQRVQISPVVQYTRRVLSSNGSQIGAFYFLHRDPLGSVDAAGTHNAGVILKTSFDAFGGRREPSWNADITAASMNSVHTREDENSPRGFTDHEMLNRTGFIHMNGRVYDPRIGRFVSPDPIVQAPFFSQSYNRYSYVFNQPTRFTDPSGFGLSSLIPIACFSNALGLTSPMVECGRWLS